MKLSASVLALAFSVSCAAVWAQESSPAAGAEERPPEVYLNPNAAPQQVFYKWYAGGKVHYSKYPPRGVSNYTKINGQGMKVSERPTSDSINVLKPLRPAKTAPADTASGNQPLPEGTITREKRCEDARHDLKVISEKTNIVEDDGNGNLIPLSPEQINERKQLAQNVIDNLCSDNSAVPAKPVPPAVKPQTLPAAGNTTNSKSQVLK